MIVTSVVIPVTHLAIREEVIQITEMFEQGLTPNVWDDTVLWDDTATWEDYSDE